MTLRSIVRRLTTTGIRFTLAALAALALIMAAAPNSAQASVFNNGVRWELSPAGYANIPICIVAGSSAQEKGDGANSDLIHDRNPTLNEVIGHMRMALASSWERWSSARFVGWKNCSELSDEERQQSVGLFVHPDAANQSKLGTLAKGRTTPEDRGVEIMPWGNTFNRCIAYNWGTTHVEYSFSCAEQYAIHEFGHLLGFEHEWHNPATPAECTSYTKELVITSGHATTYSPDNAYTIVNPDSYDPDSIMTYDRECADVTGVRFGSPNLSRWDILGVQQAYPLVSSSHGQFDIGVIPDATGCRDTSQIAIHMDDENDDNASAASGWVGATLSQGNTRFEVCRVDGSRFAPSAAGAYAVLRLGSSCPVGSSSFFRHFDNEDGNAGALNYMVGDVAPNNQPLSGHDNKDTDLYFCVFSSRYMAAAPAPFPTLSYSYGVFAAGNFGAALATGQVHTDDEDEDNANRLWVDDLALRPSVLQIIEIGDGRNTTLHMAKVNNRSLASATTGAASAIGTAGATLNATVNAHNSMTTVTFEWGTQSRVYSQRTAATPSLIGSASNTPVSAPLSGLTPNTTYYYRVVAANELGTVQGAEQRFTTQAVPPIVTTNAASDITSVGALLHGTVNAQNANTTVWFGFQAPNVSGFTLATPQVVTGLANTAVTALLSGLMPNTTYQFRVAAQSGGGQARGVFLQFTTAPVAADDSYSTDEDTALTIAAPGLLANDSIVSGNPLTPSLVSSPLSGTLALNADGSFIYMPNADFNGADSFTYKVSNGLDSNVATVRITVNPVDDPATLAIAAGGQCALENDPSAAITLSLADLDTPADSLTVSATSSNAALLPDSSIVISGTGASRTLGITALPQQHGQATITIAVSDGHNQTTLLINVIVGTTGADVLNGSDGPDIIFGLQGADTIAGLGGDDLLCGNDGDDSIDGGGGDDAIYAGDSNDHVLGGNGDDMLDAGKGDDALDGGAGNDTLAGWSGRDALSGGDGNDTIAGGNSDDTLDGGAGDDALEGGKGDDQLTGGLGADAFYTSLGHDQETDFDAGQGDTHPSAAGPALRSLVERQEAEPEIVQ